MRNGKFGPELDRRKSNSFVLAAPSPAEPENPTIQATISTSATEASTTHNETSSTSNPTENITLLATQDTQTTPSLETASVTATTVPEATPLTSSSSLVPMETETESCDKEFQIESFQISTKHKYVAFLIPFLLLMLLALGIVVLL